MSQNGKGDRPREVDKDKYDEGYESIIWTKKEKEKKCLSQN